MGMQREGLRKKVSLLFFLLSITGFVTIQQDSTILVRISGQQQQGLETTVSHASSHDDVSKSAWDTAILEAKEQLSKANISVNKTQGYDIPTCLRPNTEKTSALVRNLLDDNRNRDATTSSQPLLPLPIMNVGMPRLGSTTLFEFFQCIGFNATHWNKNTRFFEGLCMRDAVKDGLPPIQTCGPHTDAFMEINAQFPIGETNAAYVGKNSPFLITKESDDCFFPQLSLLEEIHAENPTITFVMNFRPIHDWVRSITNWYRILPEFQTCDLPNLPRGYPEDTTNETQVLAHMAQYLCSHVQHVRNFVEAHPSHTLIELDLYDEDHSREVMSTLFPLPPSEKTSEKSHSSECWGHANKSGSRAKKMKQNMKQQMQQKKNQKGMQGPKHNGRN